MIPAGQPVATTAKQPPHRTSMAIDQYGQIVHDLGPHPRKGLLAKLGAKHATKVYVDKRDGRSVHIGYIIQGRLFTIYWVERMEREQ